jgi:PhzF family phenazine biosynthesis protein
VVAAQVLDNGPAWLSLLLESPDAVLQLAPNHAELKKIGQKVGVAGIHRPSAATNSGAAPLLEVRAFAAPIGIEEDPVTGSLNASLAQWLMDLDKLPTRYVAAQGTCIARAGRVHVERDAAGQVWVGGESVSCIDGLVTL